MSQMFWTAFKRVVKGGFVSFYRSGLVSVASILVVTVTLFVIGSLIFARAILDHTLTGLKEKVDVNVYFAVTAPEDKILEVKDALELLPEVESVEYVSREEALERFRARHENDELTLQALEELGENPLGAALNIKAREASQYESIARFLGGESAVIQRNPTIIDKVNYYQNKPIIDRLNSIIEGGRKLGIAVTLLLIILSIIITFNTVRLVIYISREEINVMRLVGASDLYIRGPFMTEGVIYGLVSSILAMSLLFPVAYWMGKNTTTFFGGLNMFQYYVVNFGQIFLLMLLSGIILGVVSAYLAVRKYLTT